MSRQGAEDSPHRRPSTHRSPLASPFNFFNFERYLVRHDGLDSQRADHFLEAEWSRLDAFGIGYRCLRFALGLLPADADESPKMKRKLLGSWQSMKSLSSLTADGSQAPKHFGKKSGAFSRLNETPISFPREPPRTAPPPSKPWKRALSLFGNILFFGSLGVGSVVGYTTYVYDQETIRQWIEAKKKRDSIFDRSVRRMLEYYLEKRTYFEGEIRSFAVPRHDQLLPDLPHAGIKTLVLDLDELLVHSKWTRRSGWKVLKRPAVKEFLKELMPYYEIVVYSDQPFSYVDPIMERLDPERHILRLSRPDTNYVDGKHVRDLSKLGRDLSQVLMISAKPDAWALQPENTIKLPPWEKDPGDTMLLDLLPFLQYLATHYLPDVRHVVQAYEGKDIPSTFRERMKQMGQEQRSTRNRGLLGTFQKP